LSNAERQNARPFFSRRIGLGAIGEPIDLNYGGKVSGRVGRFELGALSIRQDENPLAAIDETTLSVVRAKAGIGSESTVGVVLTEGDPLTPRESSLAGFDALYRNSRLPGGRTIEVGAWYQQTETEWLPNEIRPAGGESAAGFGVSVPSNNKFRGAFSTRRVEANFYPALGFTSRTDVQDYAGQIAYTHRPGAGRWQSLFFNLDGQRIEGLDGRLQSQQIGLTPLQAHTRQNDMLYLRSNFEKEVLIQDFEIRPGVIIPGAPGGREYSFTDHGIEFGFSAHRRFSGRIARTDGGFYNGGRVRTFGNFTWAASPRFRTSVGFNIQEIDLPVPNGKFSTRIINTTFDVVFSSRLSWTNLIQYDNVSEVMGLNLRLNWIPEAGRELFFVINHNMQDFDGDNRFHSLASDVVAKASYTFRF
jgi:hypothetical protein